MAAGADVCVDPSGDDGAFAWILSPVTLNTLDVHPGESSSSMDSMVSTTRASERCSNNNLLRNLLALENDEPSSADEDGDRNLTVNASNSIDCAVTKSPPRSVTDTKQVSPAPKVAARKRQSLHSHTRRRQEIATLKELVRRLDGSLLRMQSPPAHPTASAPGLVERSKRAAGDQLGLLRRAQNKNAELRAALVAQKKLTRSLQRLLLMRATKIAILSDRLGVFRVSADFDLTRDDHALFARMIVDLNAMHASAAIAIAAREQDAPVKGSYRRWQVRLDEGGQACLDVVTCVEFPFRNTQLGSAIAALLHNRKSSIRVHDPQRFGGSRDIVATDYRLLNSVGAKKNHRQRRVSRSLTDGTRSMAVSVGTIDSIDSLGHPIPGFVMKVQMWIVRTERAFVDPVSKRTEWSTVMQNFTTITPVAVRGVKTFRWSRSSVEDILIPLWDREISNRQQRLEDALMDQHCAG